MKSTYNDLASVCSSLMSTEHSILMRKIKKIGHTSLACVIQKDGSMEVVAHNSVVANTKYGTLKSSREIMKTLMYSFKWNASTDDFLPMLEFGKNLLNHINGQVRY